MKSIWIVKIGIDNRSLIDSYVFKTKKEALNYIKLQFEGSIKELKGYDDESDCGLRIGNSYEVEEIEFFKECEQNNA